MFKHILLPTDGSELSSKAVALGFELAKTTGARVTGLHVIVDPIVAHGLGDTMLPIKEMAKQAAEAVMKDFGRAATQSGVAHESIYVHGSSVWEEINRVAADRQCDLICMASHGRTGISAVLLGSETTKVLTHARVPVLVSR